MSALPTSMLLATTSMKAVRAKSEIAIAMPRWLCRRPLCFGVRMVISLEVQYRAVPDRYLGLGHRFDRRRYVRVRVGDVRLDRDPHTDDAVALALGERCWAAGRHELHGRVAEVEEREAVARHVAHQGHRGVGAVGAGDVPVGVAVGD